MAAPVTLTAWRAFIDRPDPRPPARLTRAAMRRLSTTAKDAYDRDRLAWLGADVVFATRDLPDLELLTTIATRRNSVEAVGPRRGIAISGPSTVGKTTALLHLGRRHETWVRQTQPDYPGLQPVAYIVVPPATTPRMMLTAFARFLGLPTAGSAWLNSDGLSDVCAAVLTESGTSMIIVDEVHNLLTNRQAGVEAASALKIFGDRINATFLYGGIRGHRSRRQRHVHRRARTPDRRPRRAPPDAALPVPHPGAAAGMDRPHRPVREPRDLGRPPTGDARRPGRLPARAGRRLHRIPSGVDRRRHRPRHPDRPRNPHPNPAGPDADRSTRRDKWGTPYPAISRLWRNAWSEFVPFLDYDVEIRKIICSTNAIESINARYRRAVRARGHFPSDQAALKCLYLVTRSLDPTGKGKARWAMRWKPALNAFAITFEGRIHPAGN